MMASSIKLEYSGFNLPTITFGLLFLSTDLFKKLSNFVVTTLSGIASNILTSLL